MSKESENTYQIWIDRGGTFTDIVAKCPDGTLATHKLLSENPERYSDAAIQGIREIMGLGAEEQLPQSRIEHIKMGTTVATNALLERKGERVALAITKGFGDALRIGYQSRPDLFAREIILPEMLYEQVIEIDERVSAQGQCITPLNTDQARSAFERAYNQGIRAIAIVLMHGYRYSDHEKQLSEVAKTIGFEQISVSHQASPLIKLVSRGDTTVVDAYLSPILRRYVNQVASQLHTDGNNGPRLMFMQSNGGLTDAMLFQGKDAILSGPAGGVVGMSRTGAMNNITKLIGFDMGGTSTDVAHYDGEYERSFETMVAGVRMRAPMMHIHTVAAGGGSIVTFDGSRFRVGPESAGADPGPACYRRGGPLTVTDCNVMLGKIQPDYFPHVFGPGGDQPLDKNSVVQGFTKLAQKVSDSTQKPVQDPEQVAEGFLRIAVENMANAIKKISVQRGYDITEYTLNCFGGAGGQHACLVADTLGMEQVFLHPFAGVLSAYGMGLADIRAMREKHLEEQFTEKAETVIEEQSAPLITQTRKEVLQQGVPAESISSVIKVHLRYEGSDTALLVDKDGPTQMRDSFETAHHKRFGFTIPTRPLVIEAISVEAIGISEQDLDLQTTPRSKKTLQEAETVTIFSQGKHHSAPLYKRDEMGPGHVVYGPAIIVETTGTVVVEDGWMAEVNPRTHLLLRRYQPRPQAEAIGTQVDPVMLEVFNNLFMSIAEQMGATLANTASSVNIKERLDFSCALFDKTGNLVANAPHVPVHLGSMAESIRTVIRDNSSSMQPGDVYMLNAPYNGGTHLPDVTVVTPFFDKDGQELLFYLGSRGHHADIGGKTPGSSPPDSTHIEEEGVLIDNFLLVRDGQLREKETRELLLSDPYPCRNLEQNLADLTAQIAANETGMHELQKIVNHFGLNTVQAYMQHVQDNGEESVRRVLDVLQDGSFSYPLDNGTVIKVQVGVDHTRREATIDFTGTSIQDGGNYNAPSAVCTAAVLYVFRTLVKDNIPLNEGCLKPLKLIIPQKSMISPAYPAAVIAGNTEVSQAITDALFGALGLLASSQGTMNNFVYGNEQYQNYETICGGTGAGPTHHGTSAVHSHMTNTRMTDPEVIEYRFPVRIEEFSIRHGSGGKGRYSGGDGVIRQIRFLEQMTATILSSHRTTVPYGLSGGLAGKCGENSVIRNDSTTISLSGNDQIEMEPGDQFCIKTPGGGGHGTPIDQ